MFLNKFQGCLIGLAVGDALGTTNEFLPKGIIESGVKPEITDMIGGGPFNLNPGQWTDDTSMALCLAQSLLDCKGVSLKDQMDKYWRWIEEGYMSSTGRLFDIGNTTSEALENYRKTGNPLAGSEDPNKSGNGSLMRLAPIPMYFVEADPFDLAFLSAEMSSTTHAAAECQWACRYAAIMIQRFLLGGSRITIIDDIGWIFKTSTQTPKTLYHIIRGDYLDKKKDQINASGYVLHTLEAALWSFFTTSNFRDGALKAVNLCEDADTTGAVFGQIAGAYYGLDGIPSEWVEKISHKNMILDIATRLHDERPTM